MAKMKFSSEETQGLIERLQRIQQRNHMTLEDADYLLTGALTLNWQFIKFEGEEKSHNQIKRVLWNRILDFMDEIA